MLSLFAMKISNEWIIEIDFAHHKNHDETLSLRWNLIDHLPSYFWLKSFKALLNSSWPYYARFSGFIDGHKDGVYLAKELNQAIDDINRCGKYFIHERAGGEFTQEFSNIIHHHFEVLYGSITHKSEIFLESSAFIQNAIERLNHAVHDMEAYHRERAMSPKERSQTFSAIVSEVQGITRHKMPEDFYDSFTLDNDFGDMVAHYSLVGKTWWEVFLDKDEEIFVDAIRPLNVLTGEFDIFFGVHHLNSEKKEKFETFLKGRGLDPLDRRLGLGYLPLAKLQRDPKLSNLDYKKKLSHFMRIQRLKLLQNDKIVSERDLSQSATSSEGFFVRSNEQRVSKWEDLRFENAPIQLVPVGAKTKGTTAIGVSSLEGFPKGSHTLCLVGASDDSLVELKQSKCLYLKGQESIVLTKGLCLDLSFSAEHGLLVLTKQTKLAF